MIKDIDANNNKNEMIKKVRKLIEDNNNNNGKNYHEINENNDQDKQLKESNNKLILNNDNGFIGEEDKKEIIKGDTIVKDKNETLNEEKTEQDPIISYMASNIKITDEDVKNSSKLILEEVKCNLLYGKKIEITAAGMVGGRNKRDGFSIFGLKKDIDSELDDSNSKSDIGNIFSSDYELNYSPFLSYPYIFTIYFKKEEKSFYIKAFSGKGSDNKVLFIKLNNKNKYILNQKELILTGNVIFQVTPLNESSIEIVNLSKKRYNIIKNIYDGTKKSKITIGRHKDCDFPFPKDKSFSRCQTTFEFDGGLKKWTIIDGKSDKLSTNGTWIFGTHSFLIKDEMIAEILNSQIKITEIKNSINNNNDDEKI